MSGSLGDGNRWRAAAGDGARIAEEPCGVGIAGGTGGAFCIAVSAVRKLVIELTQRENCT
jgi:hypothetical protein